MRGIPGWLSVDPCDALEIEQAVPAIAITGAGYMRLLAVRCRWCWINMTIIELGKAKLLEDGNDVLIISSGLMTMRALEAAEKLRADNIGVRFCTCRHQPLDRKRLLNRRRSRAAWCNARTHAVGAGGALAALLMRRGTVELDSVGLPEGAFLLAAPLPTLHDR
ncbi:hypothetical protein LAD59_19300 [Klebsiella pneumoniae]|nr:hypothetical protein [Klebsiella pneumoniae]